MRQPLSHEELAKLDHDDWLIETATLRDWITGGGVDTSALMRELRQWTDFFTAVLTPSLEPETFAEGLTPEQLAPGQEPYVDPPVVT